MSIIQKNILRMKQVQEATGLSKSTIYLFIRQGKFKKPFAWGKTLLAGYRPTLKNSSMLASRQAVQNEGMP